LVHENENQEKTTTDPEIKTTTKCFFKSGELETRVYDLSNLRYGHSIEGPAIIIDKSATILVEPETKAYVDSNGNLELDILGKTFRLTFKFISI
jgi:5-oxoprolinase (ATP-hydrolysing)